MSNLFEHCRTRVSSTKSKIRISEGKSKLVCILPSGSIFGASQSTNKRGQCQIYLNIAEREYLRRSQRYEKSGAEANYFQFCLTRTEHPRRNRRQKVRSYRPQRTSSGRTPPSIPRTGDKRATTTAYGKAASGGRRIQTVRNRRQQDAGT